MASARPDETLRQAIRQALREDETACVERLAAQVPFEPGDRDAVAARATALVERMRAARRRFGGIDDFLQEYGLTTPEGVALMCLAEALLRVPDAETADRLIADKLGGAEWQTHLGHSESWFVNASTLALMLSGRVVGENFVGALPTVSQLVARVGEPVVRQAVRRAMQVLGGQFVIGRTIGDALKRAAADEAEGYCHSFDMLGEAARTAADAERYFEAYRAAIDAIGAAAQGRDVHAAPGISVKLSALFPRYEFRHAGAAVPALTERLLALAQACGRYGIGLTVDAEEANRLDLSLDIVSAVYRDPTLDGWAGFGLAVQAYQKRALPVVDWLIDLARTAGRPLAVRLVKGAYWDSEIKWAQQDGLAGYPVFTRKSSTDVSYLACAARLAANRDVVYPMFATHNAHTLAAVLQLTGDAEGFEFQRLHGMGEPLYHQLVGAAADPRISCRIYAPVGSHEDLLPYLVRRLLENGANTSFVNRLGDDAAPIDEIIADPVETTQALAVVPHPRIPLPGDLYAPERRNSAGIDLADPLSIAPLLAEMGDAAGRDWRAGPVIDGDVVGFDDGAARPVADPADHRRIVGEVVEATAEHVGQAFAAAAAAFDDWSRRPADERAGCLERAADLMEEQRAALMALAVREAGKTIDDALAEVREAVDFCRYYAQRARADFSHPLWLGGPTGERNEVALAGRGVFVCISPWNFPLAIFTGQVAAALAAGNAVIAKPAEQTPLIAFQAVRLLHEAGVPPGVLNLLPGSGAVVGQALVGDARTAGVAFTGSTETAWAINRTLAARDGPIAPFIAETGGQNAMIVDATALPEQVVDDAITSGFRSAGQRCSALRVMFVQDDVADRILEMLRGASAELVLGDPLALATDVGPIIDADALATLTAHAQKMARTAATLVDLPLPEACAHGTFLGPKAYEIDSLDILEREVFGPIIHVVRYAPGRLDDVIAAVNRTGYGLTLGIHSRIDATQRYIAERVHAGNAYVNRSMIGAVVGVQPFGGEGLSGTGPKAGGPRYLHRFAVERTLSVNTTAAGGNTTLVTLED